jgi:hypothetical protein
MWDEKRMPKLGDTVFVAKLHERQVGRALRCHGGLDQQSECRKISAMPLNTFAIHFIWHGEYVTA